MARSKFAGKPKNHVPATVGVLVPKDESLPVVIEALSNNPELQRYAALTAMHVLQTWSALATADVTELSRVECQSCRYCHGLDHRYHWTNEDEWALEVAQAIDRGKEPKTCDGGFGYDPHRKPSPTCPSCFGDGVARVVLTDYRDLSPAARLLYDGAKVDKNGNIEVKHRDRDAMLRDAGKYLGMFKDQVEHTGAGGAPIQFILSPAEQAL